MHRRFLAVVLALCSVALLSGGCTSDRLEYLRLTIDGQNVLGITRQGVPIRGVVVFFHGLDRDESILELDDPHRELSATLADAGYAVVSSNASGNAFGSALSQRNYEQLTYSATQYYRTQEVFFLAESMGTIAAINLMVKNSEIPVAGLAAINPLLNFDSLPSEYQEIAQDVNPDVRGSNPLDFPVASMTAKNFRFYVVSDDDLVSTPGNSTAFENRFGRVANISVVKCTGGHMDPSCIQGKDIARWFSSISRR